MGDFEVEPAFGADLEPAAEMHGRVVGNAAAPSQDPGLAAPRCGNPLWSSVDVTPSSPSLLARISPE